MAERLNAVVTAGELRLLVERMGLRPVPYSPLAPVMTMAPATSDQGLRDQNLLSGSWSQAIGVLADPAQEIRTIVPAPQSSVVSVFYRGAAGDGQLVGCWVEEGRVRLSSPWTAGDVAALTGEALWVTPPNEAAPYRATFSPAALTAWAAAVDALRMIMFGSLLHRSPKVDVTLTLADLREQVSLGLSNLDARWLVTLVRVLAPPVAVPQPEALAQGVRELEGLGLLRPVLMNAWRPLPELQQFASYLKNPLPAAAVEVSSGDSSRTTMAMRGDGPLWVFDVDGLAEGRPQVTVSSLSGDGYLAHVRTLLATVELPRAAMARPPAAAVGVCPACGAPLRPGAAFCTQCGARRGTAKRGPR